MEWNEQLAKAKALGLEHANNSIAGGQQTPDEEPLSGEWAGAITYKDVVDEVTGEAVDHYGPEANELCDAWEEGYNSAPWPLPAGELCEHGLSAHLCGGPMHWYDHEH